MRLIDADKLLQQIKFDYDLDYGETLINPRDFADAVCNSPTVDAVPVVRCRDCKHLYPDNYGYLACAESGAMLYPNENDFCSRGQRRDQSADVRKKEDNE